jgi:hypothetical protein
VYTAVVPKATPDPRIDAYIAKAAPFAGPIVTHLRALVHKACPEVAEDFKWGRPFFLHNGTILCNVSAFKAHCSFGFWGAEIGKVLMQDGVLQDGGMGSLGKITSLTDLPSDKQLIDYIRQAAALIDSGKEDNRIVVARGVVKASKPPVDTPRVHCGAQEEQGCELRVRGIQPELQARVCGMDRRCQASRDSRAPH